MIIKWAKQKPLCLSFDFLVTSRNNVGPENKVGPRNKAGPRERLPPRIRLGPRIRVAPGIMWGCILTFIYIYIYVL